ncbi:hypothetical protein HLB44_13330 [Aquincola sp. S2]|uniref:Uncharacterized protein n=1 Tax=Pseudaquabacterium terrae TaxID=2732868 RepID=A0ABX2EH71_9BURK|nr:hypothetical protein [Aquabacterium terrae]NRF67969.1 hypothetical protein [Aquabacterium terrae]
MNPQAPLQLLTPHRRDAVSRAARARATQLRDEAQDRFWAAVGRTLRQAIAAARTLAH